MCDLKLFCVSLLITAIMSDSIEGYKILGVFSTPSKSHFIIGDAIMRALADKGHDVTVISPYPMKNKNYRGIEIPSMLPQISELMGDFLEMRNQPLIETFFEIYDMGAIASNTTLNEPGVKKLIASKQKFDIIVMDLFVNEALFGFADHFNAPIVVTGLFGAVSWNTDLVGTPSPPSYVPSPFMALTDRMSLLERISNLVIATVDKVVFDHYHFPRQERLFKEHFSNSKYSLEQLRRNTSLVLLNQHFSLSFPRPYLPNMIEVGGLHINRKRTPLPADLQKFLDEAKDGVIYFSMGTNLKSKNFPPEKRDAFLSAFKSLKQRVLWKFEDTNLPGKSDNVYISEWFSQDDVLAHPNVKFFITHGGLLSTIESIYHGKPFIGIPIFGDQFLNMVRYEATGIAITVDYNTLNADNFKAAITEMLTNRKYENLMHDMSNRYHDQPVAPMELAIYWIEYVARHNGAPHLHCAAQELGFIQYHNLDAIVILYGGILLTVYLIVWLSIKVILYVIGDSKGRTKLKSN